MFHARLFCYLVLLPVWMFLLGCERERPEYAGGKQEEASTRIKMEAKEIFVEMERCLQQGGDTLGFVRKRRSATRASWRNRIPV